MFRFTDGIITAATPGGQQFVSIDGKKTYFDVGPTRMPPSYANGQPVQGVQPQQQAPVPHQPQQPSDTFPNALSPLRSPELGQSHQGDLISAPSINR